MPKNWKDILILDWRGSRLKNLYFDTPDAEGIFFEYNADGIRIEKTYAERAGEVPVYTDVYTVDGSKILSEQRTDEETGNVIRTIYYVYDANGQPVGMKYNGVQYWYQKNMQGDVVRILNASGAEVVSYAYDAWGKVLSVSGSLSSTVGAANPFRYRGYYYDTETGWYYLNTRYYDPNVGRFLSPDTILGANGGLLGYNLYAYCNNNPVMFADPSGQELLLTFAIGGLATLFAVGIYEGAVLISGLVEAGADMVEEWVESDDRDTSPNVLETPAPTIEDIKNDIITYQERNTYTTIFPMPEITFEADGNVMTFDPYAPELPSIMIKKAGDTGAKGRANEKKQGRERKEKKKNKKDWNPNPNKKPMIQPRRHTPGRDHRKY